MFTREDMQRRVRSLHRDNLEEIVMYAISGLWQIDDCLYDLDRDVTGSDYIEHLAGILDRHGLTPPPLPVDDE